MPESSISKTSGVVPISSLWLFNHARALCGSETKFSCNTRKKSGNKRRHDQLELCNRSTFRPFSLKLLCRKSLRKRFPSTLFSIIRWSQSKGSHLNNLAMQSNQIQNIVQKLFGLTRIRLDAHVGGNELLEFSNRTRPLWEQVIENSCRKSLASSLVSTNLGRIYSWSKLFKTSLKLSVRFSRPSICSTSRSISMTALSAPCSSSSNSSPGNESAGEDKNKSDDVWVS